VNAGGSIVLNQAFTNPSGHSVTLSGGTLSTPSLTNASGGTLSGFGLVNGNLTNAGTTTFIGPSQVVGALANSAGATLAVRNSQLLVTGTGTNNGTITTVSGGSAVFNGGLTGNPVGASFLGSAGDTTSYAKVSLRRRADGGDSSTLSTVSIQTDEAGNPLGRIDLADNSLTINYGGGPSPDAQVRSYLAAGYAHGTWTGFGITSSIAALDPGHLTVGYADGADGVVAGLPAGQEPVKLTRIGDVNLDGTVGFADLLALAQHYGESSAKWDRGDLNYDGTVGFDDLLLLAQNYGATLSVADFARFNPPLGSDIQGASGEVPEPGKALPLVLTSGLFARRRNTRSINA
jgi:hypothetical protein